VAGYKKEFFESTPDRNAVERALKERPQPEGCALHVDEADEHVARAEAALEQARDTVHRALLTRTSNRESELPPTRSVGAGSVRRCREPCAG
jgi:hypothetical protein